MQEKENLLRVLGLAREAILKEDVVALKELSNQTIHSASIQQDPDSIALAVIVYSMSKIIERRRYRALPGWEKFYKKTIFLLKNAENFLKKDDEKGFRRNLGGIRKNLNNLSPRLRGYIKDVFNKSEINKASKIYEHGVSLRQTAKLLGISTWELSEYSGQKPEISDINLSITKNIKTRIKTAEEAFK